MFDIATDLCAIMGKGKIHWGKGYGKSEISIFPGIQITLKVLENKLIYFYLYRCKIKQMKPKCAKFHICVKGTVA